MSEEPIHRNLHPELHSILLEFHGLNEHPLRGVWHVYTDECLDKIVLEFEQNSLMVEAEPNDDSIMFHVINNNDRDTNGWIDTSRSEVWRDFIGEPFGWGWITINQQDFLDGVLLSFNGITPQVMLNVMASSIEESIIHQPSEKNA